MKRFKLLIVLLCIMGCKSIKPVNLLCPKGKIEVKTETKYVMLRLPNFDTLKKLDSLKNENHLLRVEIDYLKEKLKKLEKLYKIKEEVNKLENKIGKIK